MIQLVINCTVKTWLIALYIIRSALKCDFTNFQHVFIQQVLTNVHDKTAQFFFNSVCVSQESCGQFRIPSPSDIINCPFFFFKQEFFENNLDFYYRENNGFHFKIATFQEYKAYSFYQLGFPVDDVTGRRFPELPSALL